MIRVFLSDPSGDAIEVTPGQTVVGRGLGCAMRFPDSEISREHLLFDLDDGNLVVEDLGSSNGSYVNGERLRVPQRLQHNDCVQVGTRTFTVQMIREHDRALLAAMVGRVPKVRFVVCPQCERSIPVESPGCPTCGSSRRDTTQTGIHSRRHRRFPIDVPMRYASDALSVDGVACDVSLSGVFVATKAVDDVGRKCTVTVAEPGGDAFEIAGVVRRRFAPPPLPSELAPPSGMGIEFRGLDRMAEDRLCLLVDRARPTSSWHTAR